MPGWRRKRGGGDGSFENSYSPLVENLNLADKRAGTHIGVDIGPNGLMIVVLGGK